MASIESKLFHSFLRLINKKSFLKLQFALGKFDFYQCLQPPKEIRKICDVEIYQINNRDVFTLKPKTKPTSKNILYLHGGAYVQSFVRQHWKFLGALVNSLHCTITVPDYPLAPRHTYRDSFDMVATLYQKLITQVSPSNLVLMGDSAGGGFALALAQKMKFESVAQPSQIILLSPWLDITLKNPEIKKIDPVDPFLGVNSLREAGKIYAGDTDPENYLLSPINGPLEGLGQITLFIGTNDLLVADTRKLNAIAKMKGVAINYYEYQEMTHVWMLLNFPESKKAKQEIIDLIRNS
jgi:acetyl esterase/lipase